MRPSEGYWKTPCWWPPVSSAARPASITAWAAPTTTVGPGPAWSAAGASLAAASTSATNANGTEVTDGKVDAPSSSHTLLMLGIDSKQSYRRRRASPHRRPRRQTDRLALLTQRNGKVWRTTIGERSDWGSFAKAYHLLDRVVHARAARPVPADAGRRAARLLRPAPRPVRGTRRPRRGAWLERFGLADRAKSKLEDLSHGNQQRVQLATALVHDPELLVLDEPFSGLDPIGIATMTEVLRERAARGRRRRVQLAPAGPRGGGVRGRRDHQPRPGRRRRAGSTSSRRAPGRRHLDVEVAGSGGAWLDGDDDHTVLERDGDRVKLLVDEHVDLDALLAAARAAGEVRRFSYEPPRLSELFMEAVTAPQPATPRRPGDEAGCASIRLVAMREILERGRSRGYLLSLVFTRPAAGAGFILPALLLGTSDEAPKIGARRRRRRRASRTAVQAAARRVRRRRSSSSTCPTARPREAARPRRPGRRRAGGAGGPVVAPGELIVHRGAPDASSRRS